jgi:RNA polymerase sigma factor (sigma-70 family)
VPRPHRSDAVDAWVAGTVQRALAYAQTLVRSRPDAEDVVQDCYRRLLTKSAEYDLPRDGTKLLFRAITNACINWTERRRPEVNLGDGGRLAAQTRTGPEDEAIGRELEDAVATAIAGLPVNQRAVIELVSLGYPVNEVAEMLDITAGNARVLLHRARQVLATQLRSQIEEHQA